MCLQGELSDAILIFFPALEKQLLIAYVYSFYIGLLTACQICLWLILLDAHICKNYGPRLGNKYFNKENK